MNDLTPNQPGHQMIAVPANTPLVPIPERQGSAIDFDYLSLLRILAKWRLLILGITLAAILIAVVVTLLTTPLYRATTTIEIAEAPVQIVETGNVQQGPVAGVSFFETQLGLMRSDTLAERTARQVNRDGGDDIEPLTGSIISHNLTIDPQPASRLVDVSFVSDDPRVAATVANALTENFVSSNLERRFASTAFARRFLEGRIKSVKDRLEASERQLVAYAQRENIINVGSGEGQTSLNNASLGMLNASLAQAQADRVTAEQEYRQASARSGQRVVADPTVQALRSQKLQLEADYQEKLGLYKPDYPAMVRLRERIDAVDDSIRSATTTVSSASVRDLQAAYNAAVGREQQLRQRVSSLTSSELDLRDRSVDYNILQREVDTNRTLYDGLLQRYKEVGVAGGVGDNLISIVDRARVPVEPFKPDLLLNLLIALVAGLAAGVGAAFLIEMVSDKIVTPDDVEQKLGLPLLGIIPETKKGLKFGDALTDTRSEVTEAYSSLRTALQYSSPHGIPRTILVTSSRPGEGKTSTSLALAMNLARLGLRTLLIDADLRNPSFTPLDPKAPGFSDLLAGHDDLASAIQRPNVDNLWLVSSGPIPPAPAELLGTPRLGELIGRFASQFDVVLVDSSPVLGLADTPLLAAQCEATVFVCIAGGNRRSAILSALRRLQGTNAKLLGIVLTRYKTRYSGYGYGYGYGYGHEYGYGQQAAEPSPEDAARAIRIGSSTGA